MFLSRKWEMFYTNNKECSSEREVEKFDQISVDTMNKRFVLDIGVDILATDGYDDELEPIDSTYVSRTIFDTLLEGLTAKSFKQVEF